MISAVTSCKQCQWWEKISYLLLAFILIFLILHATTNHSTYKDMLFSALLTFVLVWTVWAIKTFYNILCWWKDLQNNISDISNLLADTKKEIHDIKNIKETTDVISSR